MCESASFGRFKQLLRVYHAGGLFSDSERVALLRESDPDEVRRALRARL